MSKDGVQRSLWQRFFGGSSSGAGLPDQTVDVGDRFFQVGMGPSVWTVERVCSPGSCKIPHVVITREGSFPDSKIISSLTLMDADKYRRDRRGPDAGTEEDEAKNPGRRRTDRPTNQNN